jgi:hypothetical protein
MLKLDSGMEELAQIVAALRTMGVVEYSDEHMRLKLDPNFRPLSTQPRSVPEKEPEPKVPDRYASVGGPPIKIPM